MARLLDDGFDHRQTPAILVAQASSPSMAHRVLAALSPIGSAEAEAVPVPQHHRRRGSKAEPVAHNVCIPHKGVVCPRREVAHHPRRGATRLAAQHGNSKKPAADASGSDG
jgi:D-alanyl-D-alanine carboxypeptidase/D-alanyl-D-alanine carboxypeptidase (penicillin-binding protein 5/6)